MFQSSKSGPTLRLEEGIVHPCRRIRSIRRFGDNIVIAAKHERLFQTQKTFCMNGEPIEEGELIIEFRSADRIAIGTINRGDADDAVAGRNHRFEIAGLPVRLVPWKATADVFNSMPGKDCNTVKALLPMHGDVVAARLDFKPRKG